MKAKIVRFILSWSYIISCFLKINKNKVVFISYTTEKLEGNFKLIAKELEKLEKYEVVYLLMKYENSLVGNVKYLINCIKQVFHVNTSNLVILDYNNFVISNFKKKDVKVLQVWHACGAVKKFGNDIEREYQIKNYDYVLSTSEIWKKPYSSAFNVDSENILDIGIPKTDFLFSKEMLSKYKKNMENKFPQIVGKKVILLAPTFRGDPIYNITFQEIDLDYISNRLGDEYIIFYKLHPTNGNIQLCKNNNVINGNNESLYQLFSISDVLISDYSSIIYDFSILSKPMIFYVPDLEEYKNDRGLYCDYEEEMPGEICKSENELIKAILKGNYDYDLIKKFNEKYIKYRDGQSTNRVVNFIETLLKTQLK